MLWASGAQLQAAKREGVKLHSLPGYYGESVALFTAVPAFLMAAWLFVQPLVIEGSISGKIPDSRRPGRRCQKPGYGLMSAAFPTVWIWFSAGRQYRGRAGGYARRPDQRPQRLRRSGCRARLQWPPAVFEAAKSYREYGKVASLRNIAVIPWRWLRAVGLAKGHGPRCAPATSRDIHQVPCCWDRRWSPS
jgi:phosphate transport system permease protein